MTRPAVSLVFSMFLLQCATLPRKTTTPTNLNYSSFRPLEKKDDQPIFTFLRQALPSLAGKKVCLVSNQAGMGKLLYLPAPTAHANKHPTWLHAEFARQGAKLIKVFTPEHGLSAQASGHGHEKGKPRYYIKAIYFLTRAQIATLFADCESIVYSLPDAGVRPFTYRTIFTRTLSGFERARKAVKSRKQAQYWLLDVPNPATYLRSIGPVAKNFSYLGEEKIPFFPGYTFGELARFYHSKHKLKVQLKIHRLQNYQPTAHFLNSSSAYTQPSPNLPTYRSTQCYWAAVFLEGTYFDIGRHSNDPFCLVGHPDFKSHIIPKSQAGVEFSNYNYTPWGGRYKGKTLHSYRMRIVDPQKYHPVRAAYEFIQFAQKNYPQIKLFKVSKTNSYWLDSLTGGKAMRRALANKMDFELWYKTNRGDLQTFEDEMQKYKLY